jgi:hypothetical protein
LPDSVSDHGDVDLIGGSLLEVNVDNIGQDRQEVNTRDRGTGEPGNRGRFDDSALWLPDTMGRLSARKTSGKARWAALVPLAPGDLRIVQASVNTAGTKGATDGIASPQAAADWLACRRRSSRLGFRCGRRRFAMKALSIRQPWAWLIVHGHKDIENRTWTTTFRGRFLVHAGRTFDPEGYRWVRRELSIEMPEPAAFDRGGIVG